MLDKPEPDHDAPENRYLTIAQLRANQERLELEKYRNQLHSIDTDIPRSVWLNSKTEDIKVVQKMIRENEINHKKYDTFIDSEWGRTLLKGLLEIQTTDKSVAQVIRDSGNYKEALVNQKAVHTVLRQDPVAKSQTDRKKQN